MKTALFILKSSRPGFWLTTAWFYMFPLGGSAVLDSADFWLGLFYVAFPLGLTLYCWNDFADRATDRANPRKDSLLFGARGSDCEIRKLPWVIIAVQLGSAVCLYPRLDNRFLWWLLALCLLNLAYNLPRWGFKQLPVLDIMNQAGYLLVFIFSSWLNDLPQVSMAVFVFGGLFAMHSHVFGLVMDIEPDHLAGRRSTAIVIGITGSKCLIAALMAAEFAIAWHHFPDAFILGFSGGGCLWFALDAFRRRNRLYSTCQMRAAFVSWNLIALLSAPWLWWRAVFV
ncbi:MAG: 4-hydroxybenzoate polyprenyltransferase [Rhodothermales bacterium]|jgi:4-hydroxybenzoate polyprenyltransferase